MKERIEKIKTHFRENKKVYITAGVTFVVTIVVAVVVESIRNKDNDTFMNHNIHLGESDIDQLNVANEMNVVEVEKLNIYNLEPGRPGKPVLHIESGDIYGSQRSAARALGMSEQNLSRHLRGIRENVDNQHFKSVNIQTQFDARWKDYAEMLDKAVEEANRTGRLPEPV